VGSALVPLEVTQAADGRRIYLKSPDGVTQWRKSYSWIGRRGSPASTSSRGRRGSSRC
jgi:hypothetical protein